MAPLARLRALPAAAALLLAGCSRVWLPESVESRVGRLVARSVLAETPARSDPRWQGYMEDMGRKIVAASERPGYHYSYYLVESSTVNAFASPDGSIFVTTGLLKLVGQDSVALAGVLAHEIGHVARRHGAEKIQSQLGYRALSLLIFGLEDTAVRQAGALTGEILDLGYGREMELEADVCAVRYLARLGYPPEASVRFLRSLLPLEKGRGTLAIERYLRSHPPTEERIRYVEEYQRKYAKR